MSTAELGQIQADVLRGFRLEESMPHARFSFVRFADGTQARSWLDKLRPHVTSCEKWDESAPVRPASAISVGFTHEGLLLITGQAAPSAPPLGLDPYSGHGAFVEGAVERSKRTPAFGDVGDSRPDLWEDHFRHDLHALVSVTAATPTDRDSAQAKVVLAGSVASMTTQDGDQLPNHEEHFGYVDGISQPDVEGIGGSAQPRPGDGTPVETSSGFAWRSIPTGEFVLGYPNALGDTEGTHALLKNGSFLVFRKLPQDVKAFQDYLVDQAAQLGVTADWVGDRMVGRSKLGAPLVAPSAATPNNDFRYSGDPKGFACPFGAHIRRANPRDDKTGPTIEQVERRRIIRRGIPYGPQYSVSPSAERGLLFIAINADIERQFEFVQASWLNSTLSSKRLRMEADKDPLVGANDGSGKFVVQDQTRPRFLWNLPRFVSVKGSAYFFLPSLDALAMLASGAAITPSWPFYQPPPVP